MDCFGHNRSELLAVYDRMMDSVSSTRKRNLEGQIGLFSMFAEEDKAASIPIPQMPELSRAERMLMEKETTGIYLSGHPMDDYRPYLKNTHVVPIGSFMDEEKTWNDDQIVSVAGVIQSVKMKTTRNNSMMAYVTLEDDTAAIEMLAFSNVISQYGGYLKENEPVVVIGRLSLRDDKEPQIVINRARPMSDYANGAVQEQESAVKNDGTLYLRLPNMQDKRFKKVRAIVNMFPGDQPVILYFSETGQRMGARCAIDKRMVTELNLVLGTENVVVK